MNNSEVIKLVDELAVITPDLIKNAKALSIDCSEETSCKIVIDADLSESQRFIFSFNFCGRGLSLVEKSVGVWVIF